MSARMAWCSVRNRLVSAVSAAVRRTAGAGGRSARSALRMTATSMASCSSAPHTGGSRPAAATPIAASDMPIPASTLCSAIRRVGRAIAATSPTRPSSSTVSTASAASDEAVEPRAPMAIPTSASASAGASLMPSPVVMTGARRCSRRTAASLPAGVSSASTSSTPVSSPTASAASARSPVARTIRVMPSRRIARIIALASGRIRSSSSSAPAGLPSTATNTVRAPSSRARLRTVLTHGGSPVTRPIRRGRA